jgi:hypothetical protein
MTDRSQTLPWWLGEKEKRLQKTKCTVAAYDLMVVLYTKIYITARGIIEKV